MSGTILPQEITTPALTFVFRKQSIFAEMVTNQTDLTISGIPQCTLKTLVRSVMMEITLMETVVPLTAKYKLSGSVWTILATTYGV
jgi:hypothetical protein